MPELEQFLAGVRRRVEAELDALVPAADAAPAQLNAAIRWSLLGGGKRFRPVLLFAVGRTFGATDERLVRTASAIEMLHTYSLIHDDLPSMDNDDLRRGRETCHVKFGEATAILAGDALQATALGTIARDSSNPAELRLELTAGLVSAATAMVAGQQMDLDAEGKEISAAELEKIHENKTGALIMFAADAGAAIGGASADQRLAVSQFAARLGLLFQIVDDILDVTQSTKTLGKTAAKDVSSAKSTYPSIFGLEGANEHAHKVHAEALAALTPITVPTTTLREIADYILNRKT